MKSLISPGDKLSSRRSANSVSAEGKSRSTTTTFLPVGHALVLFCRSLVRSEEDTSAVGLPLSTTTAMWLPKDGSTPTIIATDTKAKFTTVLLIPDHLQVIPN